MNQKGICILFIIGVLQINTWSQGTDRLATKLKKEKIRILITDSGTGGLSVIADLAMKLEKKGVFKQADLIFANALFDAKAGYNALPEREDKIKMFNRALEGMNKQYKPDLIFVACNTLSVLLPETSFVQNKSNPIVIGIVEAGVDLLSKSLQDNSGHHRHYPGDRNYN